MAHRRASRRRRRQGLSRQLACPDEGPTPVSANPSPKLHRVTVFVVSDPIYRKLTPLPSSDTEVLMGALSALLRSLPSESACVIVCSLGLEKESFRSNGFRSADFAQAAEAVEATEAGTIGVANLRSPQLRLDFLAGLINRELRADDSSDIVVFLGAAQEPLRVPRQMIAASGAHPRFIYIQYSASRYAGASNSIRGSRQICNNSDTGGTSWWSRDGVFDPRLRLAPAAIRDAISDAVSILKGQTFAVSTPASLLRSLSRIVEAAGRDSKVIRP